MTIVHLVSVTEWRRFLASILADCAASPAGANPEQQILTLAHVQFWVSFPHRTVLA